MNPTKQKGIKTNQTSFLRGNRFSFFIKVLPHFPVSNNRASCQWVIFFMYIVVTK